MDRMTRELSTLWTGETLAPLTGLTVQLAVYFISLLWLCALTRVSVATNCGLVSHHKTENDEHTHVRTHTHTHTDKKR